LRPLLGLLLRFQDCLKKVRRLPHEVKRALVERTQELAESEGIDPTEAAKRVINERLEAARRDIKTVSKALDQLAAKGLSLAW
jgi:hypothetical protein